MQKLDSINKFLALKNIAVVGVSSTGKGFGVSVYNHLKERNYNVTPINLIGGEVNGEKLETSLKSLKSKIKGIITVVPPVETEKVVREAKELGINKIWMQQGSESLNAIKFCNDNNIDVVHGECIMMFSEPVNSIHKFHRGLWKLFGKYPK
jgi:predicted CoA-binding protein